MNKILKIYRTVYIYKFIESTQQSWCLFTKATAINMVAPSWIQTWVEARIFLLKFGTTVWDCSTTTASFWYFEILKIFIFWRALDECSGAHVVSGEVVGKHWPTWICWRFISKEPGWRHAISFQICDDLHIHLFGPHLTFIWMKLEENIIKSRLYAADESNPRDRLPPPRPPPTKI